MSAKKASSTGKDAKDDRAAAPGDAATGTPEVPATEGSDAVMSAQAGDTPTGGEAGDTRPDLQVEAVEHDPRPATAAAAATAAVAARPDVHLESVRHDPRPASMARTYGAAAATGAAAAASPAAEAATAPPTPAAAPMARDRSGGGFFPALLGGVIAAALGFGLAYLMFGGADPSANRLDELETRQSDQAAAIDQLRSQVEAGPDLSSLDERFDGFGSDLSAVQDRLDVMAGDMSEAAERITALEKRPVTESVSQEAIAAYEQELDRLRQAMEDQRTEVEALIEDARQMESDANATAAATMQRAALTRILSALDTGAPYAAALADLQEAGMEVPEALAANAESGVPSLADLRAAYPDAARRALSAARANDAGGRSIGDFLRDNLGARSLEPRDGDDADAVLSRAEGALKAGRLGDALAELETLPDASRAELSGWIEQAETRRNAIAAAEELNASLSDS